MKNKKTLGLVESATLLGESSSEAGTWKVRIINEGKGSSGYYSAELLERHEKAFSDALSFTNHPTGWDGPESRDFTMIAGQIVGESWSERDSSGRVGIYGNFKPDAEHKEKLEAYKNRLGLSIYIEGSGELDDKGEFQVEWLNEADPYKSVDVVIAPGRGGKLAVESLRRMYSTHVENDPGTGKVQEQRKENKLELEDVVKGLEALGAKLDALVTASATEAEARDEALTVEGAVTDAISAYDAAVEAIEAAELLPAQAKAIRAEAKAGRDVTEMIENAKEVRKELEEALASRSQASGYVREGASTSVETEGYKLRGFGGRK